MNAVRSLATPGPETVVYGGDTSCVAVTGSDPEHLLVLDAGTGIRKLGTDLGPTGVRASLFFSHMHWDHIQGFPFFTPAYLPGNRIKIYGCHVKLEEAFRRQHAAPSFPVAKPPSRLSARSSPIFLSAGSWTAISMIESSA